MARLFLQLKRKYKNILKFIDIEIIFQ